MTKNVYISGTYKNNGLRIHSGRPFFIEDLAREK
jgi:hypothetical protein